MYACAEGKGVQDDDYTVVEPGEIRLMKSVGFFDAAEIVRFGPSQ